MIITKIFGFSALVILYGLMAAPSPTFEAEQDAIETVKKFAKAGDDRDLEALNAVLHPEFRTILNRAFGSEEVSIMTKQTYMDLIKAEKIGGAKRKVSILSVDTEGNLATVKARLESDALVFISYFQLVQDKNGSWSLISDMPFVEKK